MASGLLDSRRWNAQIGLALLHAWLREAEGCSQLYYDPVKCQCVEQFTIRCDVLDGQLAIRAPSIGLFKINCVPLGIIESNHLDSPMPFLNWIRDTQACIHS